MIKISYKKIFVTAVFALSSFFCFGQSNPQETKNITIIESEHQYQLNPQLTDYAADVQILTGLYEGLFSYNPLTLEPQYAIAVSYSISRDKKRWTFYLNPLAKFSDGTKITANDVRASWVKLLSEPNAPYASLLDVIEGAKEFRCGQLSEEDLGIYALSEEQLLIHLCKPASYLPKILCHPAFSVVSSKDDVYSGAYCLAQKAEDLENEEDEVFDEEATIVLEKNPYYWDKEHVFTQTITFVQSEDQDDNAYAYNTGNADWISAPINTKLLIEKESLLLTPEFATCYLFFKNSNAKRTSESVWDHLEFRQALFEAMPWDAIRSVYYVPATTFVYPLNGYPQVEGYSYTDLIEAKKLMKIAREKYGIAEDEKIPLVMEISKNSLTNDQLLTMRMAFKELNIDFYVKTVSISSYLANVKNSDSDIFIYTWVGDFADPMAFLELFRSDSSLNDSGYNSKEFDDLLNKASSASISESYMYYAQAESLLLDDCMVFPIHHPVSYNVIDTESIGGWAPNAFDIHPLKYLYKKEKITLPLGTVI